MKPGEVVPVFDDRGECVARVVYDPSGPLPYVLCWPGPDQVRKPYKPRYGTLAQAQAAARQPHSF